MKIVVSLAGLLVVIALSQTAEAQTLDAFLENAAIKVGVNRTYGGAITWLSISGGVNLVNNYDKGRQIQQSYSLDNCMHIVTLEALGDDL